MRVALAPKSFRFAGIFLPTFLPLFPYSGNNSVIRYFLLANIPDGYSIGSRDVAAPITRRAYLPLIVGEISVAAGVRDEIKQADGTSKTMSQSLILFIFSVLIPNQFFLFHRVAKLRFIG